MVSFHGFLKNLSKSKEEGSYVKVIIAGNGVSSITLVKELKKLSNNANIEIFTDEPRPFYWRPRLIEILANEASIDRITPYDKKWYADHNVKLHLSDPVVKVNPNEKKLVSKSGLEVKYDVFVFANGCKPFVLPIPGKELKNVYSIRTYEDVIEIKKHYGTSKKFVIIGGGILGIEVAAALNRAGERNVTIVEYFPYLLPRQLDKPGATILKASLEKKYQIKFLLGKTTSELKGNEKVEKVVFSDKSSIEADVVLFSTGVRPRISIAREAGVDVEKGVVVDDHLQTNVKDIYAIGDVAQHRKKLYGTVPPSVEQARTLANVLSSNDKRYQGSVMANMLKVAGIDLLSIGVIDPDSGDYTFASNGDMNKGLYKKVLTEESKLVGAITIGIKKTNALKVKKLVDSGASIDSMILEYVKF